MRLMNPMSLGRHGDRSFGGGLVTPPLKGFPESFQGVTVAGHGCAVPPRFVTGLAIQIGGQREKVRPKAMAPAYLKRESDTEK